MNVGSLRHRLLRPGGLRWFAGAAWDRIAPARLKMRDAALTATRGRTGIEIGGPSRVFGRRGMLPIYPNANRIDNVNFAADTAWERTSGDNGSFHFDARRAPGTQWVRDATNLEDISDGRYDFVISSHCLEHTANPLGALQEWRRVVPNGGYLILVLPDPRRTFDHARPITALDHLREDQRCTRGEDDQTHLPEVLALHDLALDPKAGAPEHFRARAERNFENRCLHHHVFDLALMRAALAEAGWTIVATESARPLHLVAFAQKVTPS